VACRRGSPGAKRCTAEYPEVPYEKVRAESTGLGGRVYLSDPTICIGSDVVSFMLCSCKGCKSTPESQPIKTTLAGILVTAHTHDQLGSVGRLESTQTEVASHIKEHLHRVVGNYILLS
jgi:hypothetical protein